MFLFKFLVVFKNFLINPDVTETVRPQLAQIIPAGAPVTVANDAVEMLPANIDKTFNDLSKLSKKTIYLLMFLLIGYFSLITAKK